MTEHRDEDQIARYLEGDLTIGEAKALEAEAATSPALSARIATERGLFDALVPPTKSDDSDAFVAGVHRRIGAREARGARRGLRPRAGWALAAAALLSAGVASQLMREPTEPEPVARGTSTESPGQWSGITAYLVQGDRPRPLGDVMSPQDELQIRYSNLGPEPARYLLVFGVDAEGGIHWYHPAWMDPGNDPEAIPLAKGEVHLNEAVSHDLPVGEMTLHGVFLDQPMGVKEAERRFAEETLRAKALLDHVIRVEVR